MLTHFQSGAIASLDAIACHISTVEAFEAMAATGLTEDMVSAHGLNDLRHLILCDETCDGPADACGRVRKTLERDA